MLCALSIDPGAEKSSSTIFSCTWFATGRPFTDDCVEQRRVDASTWTEAQPAGVHNTQAASPARKRRANAAQLPQPQSLQLAAYSIRTS